MLPSHAHLMVQDGETVEAGDVLAKIPRETTKTKNITGDLHPTAHRRAVGAPGLPRGVHVNVHEASGCEAVRGSLPAIR